MQPQCPLQIFLLPIIGLSLSPREILAIAESPVSTFAVRRYYAQLWVDLGNGKKTARRFPLRDGDNQPVRTLSAAREALEIKRHETARESAAQQSAINRSFAITCATYFEKAKVQRKRPDTVANERQAIARWCDHLGHVRIDQIATPLIASYIDKRLKGGKFCGRKLAPVSERTANLDIIRLRNVLKSAVDDGYVRELPKVKMLDEAPPPKRNLVTPTEFDRLIDAARNAMREKWRTIGGLFAVSCL